ncbi:unnamed protein product [Trifolium pratense]|uniref:Uncharacterized protein n=1 Tax=Trifolium pratense TaxID=57577 RepID=A0ACB0KAN9_TRIPR|nr:unnamed protein product [Trifolium pratense]
MPQNFLFVYTLIIFLSLILIVTIGDRIPCTFHRDCPIVFFPLYMKCINYSFLGVLKFWVQRMEALL